MKPLHERRMRVAFVDTDASGRIHWGSPLRWAEIAEHALLRSLGRPAEEAVPYPRRQVEIIYHQALRFDDEFDLRLGVEKIGRTAVTFTWQAVRGGQLCVAGSHVVVHVDEHGRPAPWPEYLRAGLT